MLVLMRRVGEWVDLPGVGSIVVVSISDNRVTLGFDMPREQAVYRREVTLQIQEGKEDKCEYRLRRVPKICGGHLILVCRSLDGGWSDSASCPTGDTVEEVRENLREMMEALSYPLIDEGEGK